MSIRWKLFVALFLLTTGTVVAVLFVAEREFRLWVEGQVTLRFEGQMNGLLEARKERLEDIRAACTRLAEHPAIRAELKGEETEAMRPGFMEQLMLERVGEVDRPGVGSADRPESGPDGPPGDRLDGRMGGPDGDREQPFGGMNRPRRRGEFDTMPGGRERPGRFRSGASGDEAQGPGNRPRGVNSKSVPTVGVIDLDGNPRPFAGPMRRARPARQPASASIGQVPDSIEQDVAYVVLTHAESGRTMVQEVVLTRVRDDDGSTLGWFFLGRNAETQVERIFQQAERTSGRDGNSGLVAEGQWFVRGMPEEETSVIDSQLDADFWRNGQPEIVSLKGKKLLAVARDLNPGSPIGKGYQVAFFPVNHLIEAIDRLHLVVLLIGVGAVVVTSGIAMYLARRFSQPIAELVAGTERVRKGDLEGSVSVRSKDEFGALATAFNAMTFDLALKERYREVLSKTSDPAVAQQLVEGQLELGGEVRQAAVLFCDIRDFTAMTEGMPPGEVIEFINEHMTALTKLVYLHGGVVDKFVGDLVMAIFGAPNSYGDDALRAARCALEMVRVRQELNQTTGRIVEIGIGVAYGELVAGCMGSIDRLNYTVLGDRVNLASRLCSNAAAGEVIVDEAIASVLDDSMAVEPRGMISLKGFSKPVASFAIRVGNTGVT